MGYTEHNLVPGEIVLYKTRLHWIVLVKPLIVGTLLGTIGFGFIVGGYEVSEVDNNSSGARRGVRLKIVTAPDFPGRLSCSAIFSSDGVRQ